MSEKIAILAVEDSLSEVISVKVLESASIYVCQTLGLKGKGYLKTRANSLNQTAKGFPVFLLTDQDSPKECPPALLKTWIRGKRHPEFFLRVAVMEVESWVLADREGVSSFLSIPIEKIPHDTDALSHPKEFLVSLARGSRKKSLREAIVPRGSTSTVGPEYNVTLAGFVRDRWNVKVACSASMSLRRAVACLRNWC